ncbi:MAG TPA: ABC transporter ATP-binding protein [Firmicutes bacterium]|nr:ABC transporter ATP-binding protein [Bacillota bacterium]
MKQSVSNENIVEVKNLKMYFPVTRGLLRRKVADVKAVDGISFKIRRGEIMGLVGESGCGKTTTGRCILRLYSPTEGQIYFNGEDLFAKRSKEETKKLSKEIAFIFQDPQGSLNPRHTAGRIIGEPLWFHNLVQGRNEYEEMVDRLLTLVGLESYMKNRFPHEFSGGQRQRIGVARALASKPSLIICDEPVSALDVSIQAQIINLLKRLQKEFNDLTYLFISHDLSVVRYFSDRIAVMYLGRIVEIADSLELYDNPRHPYTKALLSAIPIPDPFLERKRERIVLKGEVPSPLNPPKGCHFHPRCPIAVEECRIKAPEMRDIGGGHEVACHLV